MTPLLRSVSVAPLAEHPRRLRVAMSELCWSGNLQGCYAHRVYFHTMAQLKIAVYLLQV
ncbi:hypothetical protein [Nocardia nova]|jgi:hypothetical protein|nr:hypothetical protein [Nocardia nova]